MNLLLAAHCRSYLHVVKGNIQIVISCAVDRGELAATNIPNPLPPSRYASYIYLAKSKPALHTRIELECKNCLSRVNKSRLLFAAKNDLQINQLHSGGRIKSVNRFNKYFARQTPARTLPKCIYRPSMSAINLLYYSSAGHYPPTQLIGCKNCVARYPLWFSEDHPGELPFQFQLNALKI